MKTSNNPVVRCIILLTVFCMALAASANNSLDAFSKWQSGMTTANQTSNARFKGGVTADAGLSFASTFDVSQKIDVLADSRVAPEHVGKSGSIYIVARYNNAWFMKAPNNQWQSWTNQQATLVSNSGPRTLQALESLTVAPQLSGLAGTFEVYVGYKVDRDIHYNVSAFSFVVKESEKPAPACTLPQVLQGGICVTPTPACTSAQILQEGVCVTPAPVPPAPSPDLLIKTFAVGQQTITAGNGLSLNVTVANEGNALAADSQLNYYLRASSANQDDTLQSGDRLLYNKSLYRLAAGHSTPEYGTVVAPSVAGDYYYGVCVKAVAGENNLANNCSSTIKVTVVEPPPVPFCFLPEVLQYGVCVISVSNNTNTLSGKVIDDPLVGAIITAYLPGTTTSLGTATTWADGSYTLDIQQDQTAYYLVTSGGTMGGQAFTGALKALCLPAQKSTCHLTPYSTLLFALTEQYTGTASERLALAQQLLSTLLGINSDPFVRETQGQAVTDVDLAAWRQSLANGANLADWVQTAKTDLSDGKVDSAALRAIFKNAQPTCTSPQILQNNICVTPASPPPPPTCTLPQELKNGICVSPNVAPTANAGANQSVTSQTLVTLDGSQSKDNDGSIASYLWGQTGGSPTVTLNNPTATKPTFTAPTVTQATELTFKLTVTDNQGATASASVKVTIAPACTSAQTLQNGVCVTTSAISGTQLGKIGGTVAVGAALAHTSVTLTDANGKSASTTTDANGRYSIDNLEFIAPVLVAAMASYSGDYGKLISIVPTLQSSTSSSNDVANLTPATTAIAAASLGKSPDLITVTDAETLDATALSNATGKLKATLKNISDLLSISPALDFSSTAFNADGTGIDKIFDLLKFSASNAVITVESREGFRSKATTNDLAGFQVTPFDWLSAKGEPIIKLAVSNYHQCVLVQSGKVYCWGNNNLGALGNGTNTSSPNVPIMVGSFTNAVDLVAADSGWSCALLADGKVYCWGSGAHGEMGQWPSTANSNIPVLRNFSTIARSISISDGPSCVVLDTGGLECWGENGGIWSVPQATLGSKAVQVSSGATHACVKLLDGSVRCLGWNNGSGELGNTVTTDLPSSRKIATVPLTKEVASVTAGGYFSCALFVDGTVQCWGRNDFGQLGNGLLSNSTTPVAVTFNQSVIALQASWTHTCAILANGTTQCWGKNDYGQLGAITTQTVTSDGGIQLPSPVAISNVPLTTTRYQGAAISIVSTYYSSCVLTNIGHFQCWGNP